MINPFVNESPGELTLNRQSKLPLYHQLYEILRSRILRGDWEPGSLIPSESELIEQYDVSRITVRQALDILVNEGLIYRQRGRGTFVAPPTIEASLSRLINFTEDMLGRGLKPATKVLKVGGGPVSQHTAQHLQIEPGEELEIIRRLRLANDEPISVEVAHFPHELCPGLVRRHDYAEYSLRKALAEDYGIHLTRAKQVIHAMPAPEQIAEELTIEPDAPIFYIERISYSQHERPAEFLRMYYRGDRYALYTELQS